MTLPYYKVRSRVGVANILILRVFLGAQKGHVVTGVDLSDSSSHHPTEKTLQAFEINKHFATMKAQTASR